MTKNYIKLTGPAAMKAVRHYALLAGTITVVLNVIFGVVPAVAQLREAAVGIWAEEDGEAWIEIAPCEDVLCGRIVWLKEPLDENGEPHVDKNNPDPALRSRPILGLLIMAGLKPKLDKGYLEGQVYNSENGKVYDVYLTPKGQTMDVEGCLMKYICLTQTWTRVQ